MPWKTGEDSGRERGSRQAGSAEVGEGPKGMKGESAEGRSTKEVRVGPAGWSYTDWAGIVYPARKEKGFREAEYLARYFDVIEINTTFYNPVRAEMAERWAEQAGGNPRFQFTAKLWQ